MRHCACGSRASPSTPSTCCPGRTRRSCSSSSPTRTSSTAIPTTSSSRSRWPDMPLPAPILDDRTFDQLREALVRRIPVYAPEWTDHNASDPGIALLELFAFLGESLLYRFNQIPESTYLAYLRLLDVPLHPAVPARAQVAFTPEGSAPVLVEQHTALFAGDLGWETLAELTVLPLTARAVAKRAQDAPTDAEEAEFARQSLVALGLEDP